MVQRSSSASPDHAELTEKPSADGLDDGGPFSDGESSGGSIEDGPLVDGELEDGPTKDLPLADGLAEGRRYCYV